MTDMLTDGEIRLCTEAQRMLTDLLTGVMPKRQAAPKDRVAAVILIGAGLMILAGATDEEALEAVDRVVLRVVDEKKEARA